MNSSPITSWENVAAYFTFADSPAIIAICFIAAVAVVAGLLTKIIRHEKSTFDKYLD